MPTTLSRYRKKWVKYFKEQTITRRIGIVALAFTAIAVTSFLLLYFIVWTGLLGSLPDRATLERIRNPVASEIYSADSVLLGRLFIQERSTVPYEKVSSNVINALIATEDHRFYDHEGIDYMSLARVLVKSILLQRESSGGGSTITQQLVKKSLPEKTVRRAIAPCK